MELVIIGAGAIGAVIGAYLTAGGNVQVTLIDKDEAHVRATAKNGLIIHTQENTRVIPVDIYTPEEFINKRKKPVEYLMLCVKSQATLPALEPFIPLLSDNGAVISVQNGLNGYKIASRVGPARTMIGFVNIFADYMEPGVISYGGKGALILGEPDGSISSRLRMLKEQLTGLDRLEISDNVYGYLWGKLGYASILAATSLTDETMADVIDDPRYRTMLMDLASEILNVAALNNISLPEFDDWDPNHAWPREGRDVEAMNRQLDIHVVRLRSYTKVHSGIWRDIAVRHRETEYFAMVAPALEQAKEKGIATPLTDELILLLRSLEKGDIPFLTEHLERLRQLDEKTYGVF